MKRLILILLPLIISQTISAQYAIKINKSDGSNTYIKVSATDNVTFVPPLEIGDTHAGGIVFYLDANGEHGLVGAPAANETSKPWVQYTNDQIHTYATLTAIGTGLDNTLLLLGVHAPYGSGIAAGFCYFATIGGYGDWYLPSIDELKEMYNALHLSGLGGFQDGVYWSSTQVLDHIGWAFDFENGVNYYSAATTSSQRVRPIRAF